MLKKIVFISVLFVWIINLSSFPSFAQTTSFLETFNTATTSGPPEQFTQLNQSKWDIAAQSRDGYPVLGDRSKLVPMKAHHPSNCTAPATYDANGVLTGLITHDIGPDVEDHVYKCNNHLMTAFAANGYGVIYLTPNHMLDFTNSEAVIRFDMTTFRSSKRDWIDVWVTPMEDEVQLPLNPGFPDLQGPPRNAIQVNLELESFFCPNVYVNHVSVVDTVQPYICKTGTTLQSILASKGLALDPKRRDTFEIRIKKNHIKVSMPAYDNPPGSAVWFDADIPTLSWSRGIVQFGHHWYSPDKAPLSDFAAPDYVNTWHWDNISIAPSVPFTIIKPTNTRYVEGNRPATHLVTFQSVAPINSHLRFSAWGENVQVSFNGGSTWQNVPRADQPADDSSHIFNYRMNLPIGIQNILLRGDTQVGGMPFIAKDFSIFSTTAGPVPTVDPNATATQTPSRTPTPTTPAKILGDVDRDGDVDIYDFNEVVANFGKKQTNPFLDADLNKNGEVDIFDFNEVVANFGK